MIAYYFKSIRDEKIKIIDGLKPGSLIVVEETTEEDLKEITSLTQFEFSDLVDVFDVYELPRVEREDEGTIVYLRNPANKHPGLYTEPLTVLLTPKNFILLSKDKNALVNELLAESKKVITTQKTKVMLLLFNKLSRMYSREIKKVSDEVMRQKRGLESVTNKDIVSLVKSEDILNQYLSSLIPLKNVFEIISVGKHLHMYEEDSDLLEDVLININQLVDICQMNLKNIISIRDAYQIIFTNNLNNTMKFLASFTIIVTIPNIIAGIFGMNVDLPLAASPFAFALILQMIVIACLIVLFVFYKKRWL